MDPSIIARGAIARLGLRAYPLGLTWELTWLCNLACTYCDRHTPTASELTREQMFTVLEQFHDLGMRTISLDGGEPLAHAHVEEIVAWLVERGIPVAMNTNGILVPRKLETVRKLSTVKISLDGPRERHDAARGAGAYDKAITGARAVRSVGVPLEFTCTVGKHNADVVEDVLEVAEEMGAPLVFQPARNSLFNGSTRNGSTWRLDQPAIRTVFAKIEALKRRGRGVGNGWASLRHFRRFPEETRPPCAAGWVFCTMDPDGVLFACGELDRSDRSHSVVALGVAEAFGRLTRKGCGECWCARLVEENYRWGVRIDKMIPPLRLRERPA